MITYNIPKRGTLDYEKFMLNIIPIINNEFSTKENIIEDREINNLYKKTVNELELTNKNYIKLLKKGWI